MADVICQFIRMDCNISPVGYEIDIPDFPISDGFVFLTRDFISTFKAPIPVKISSSKIFHSLFESSIVFGSHLDLRNAVANCVSFPLT